MSVAAHTPAALVSIVVPLFNEEESVGRLVHAVRESMPDEVEWELILVDDGSEDETAASAQAHCRRDARIRLIALARNYGQSTAMQAGFDAARGDRIVTLDGDLQNDPRDIPSLLDKLSEGFDLVTGYRVRRRDTLLTRKIPSFVANRIIRAITGVSIRDNGCSLKAYRRDVIERMRLYSDLHRFIPALAAASAGARISEIPVRHHARRFGRSKYGLSRIPKVAADLLTILMIRFFRERPLKLFGLIALPVFIVSVVLHGLWIVPAMLDGETGVAQTFVLPSIALLLGWLAAYLLMLGIIAETVLRDETGPITLSTPLVREVGR